MIIARYLAPDDFGLMGIALLTLQTLEAFSQTGFQAALIQKKGTIEDEMLDVAWTLMAVRGIALFLITAGIAPVVSSFFHSPESMLLIKVISVCFLLKGLGNIGVIFFQKELDFKKQFAYEGGGVLADFFVSVIFVIIFQNVWVLVAGKITGELTRLVFGYVLSPYRPSPRLNIGKARELCNFGRWVSLVYVISYIVAQGDSLFVGRVLGTLQLGIYRLASTISNLPSSEITGVITQVMFPAYSKLTGNRQRLQEVFLKTLHITMVFSVFITVIIMCLIHDFTMLFLGEKWLPIVFVTQILVISGLIRSLQALAGAMFQAIGRPKMDTICQFLRLSVFILILVVVGKNMGLRGVALAVLISMFVTCIASYLFTVKLLGINRMELFNVALAPAIGAIGAYTGMILLKSVLQRENLVGFSVQIAICTAVYFGMVYLVEFRYSKYVTVDFIRNIMRKPIRTERNI